MSRIKTGCKIAKKVDRNSGNTKVYYQVTEYHDWPGAEAIAGVWDSLAQSRNFPTVFLTPDWYKTWWEIYGRQNHLIILAAATEGKIVAIAPLMITGNTILRIKFNEIRFIATHLSSNSPQSLTGTQDILCANGHEEAITVLLEYAMRSVRNWVFIRLQPVSVPSATFRLAVAVSGRNGMNIRKNVVAADACVVKERLGNDEYFQTLSSNYRKKIKRAVRRLETAGYDIRVEGRDTDHAKLFETIEKIESNSWKASKGVRFSEKYIRRFFKFFLKTWLPTGNLEVFVLRINDKPVAYDMHILFSNHVTSIRGSYDESYQEFSPGSILTWRAHESFVARGFAEVHMLFGNFAYKCKWTNRLRPHARILITNNTWFARGIDYLYHANWVSVLQRKIRKLV
jgi:CelD/BcsL family acetyltransferase involved in cellulose biosynthesis